MTKTKRLSVVRGTLELLVLKTLSARGESHGFEILEWMRSAGKPPLDIEEGALYPALHRMEKRGWLDSEWAVSDLGRKAKYYHLSATGRAAAKSESKRWAEYVKAVEQLSHA